jgi:hypothetical protein
MTDSQTALSTFWKGKGAESGAAGLGPLIQASQIASGKMDRARLSMFNHVHASARRQPSVAGTSTSGHTTGGALQAHAGRHHQDKRLRPAQPSPVSGYNPAGSSFGPTGRGNGYGGGGVGGFGSHRRELRSDRWRQRRPRKRRLRRGLRTVRGSVSVYDRTYVLLMG